MHIPDGLADLRPIDRPIVHTSPHMRALTAHTHKTPQWWSTIAAAKLPNFQHGKVLFPFPLLKLVPYRANLYRRTQVGAWLLVRYVY